MKLRERKRERDRDPHFCYIFKNVWVLKKEFKDFISQVQIWDNSSGYSSMKNSSVFIRFQLKSVTKQEKHD